MGAPTLAQEHDAVEAELDTLRLRKTSCEFDHVAACRERQAAAGGGAARRGRRSDGAEAEGASRRPDRFAHACSATESSAHTYGASSDSGGRWRRRSNPGFAMFRYCGFLC